MYIHLHSHVLGNMLLLLFFLLNFFGWMHGSVVFFSQPLSVQHRQHRQLQSMHIYIG